MFLSSSGPPVVQQCQAIGYDRVLVKRVAAAAAYADILCRLQKNGSYGQVVELGAAARAMTCIAFTFRSLGPLPRGFNAM